MTAQVLVYTERKDFRTLIEIECKGLTGFAPVVKESIEDLSGFLSLMPSIDLLVIDNASKKDYKFVSLSDVKNIFILSDIPVQLPKSKTFPGNAAAEMIEHLKSLFGQEKVPSEGYISIPIDSFLHFKTLPFDLYIKLGEGNFVKRINANEDIEETSILKLKEKGVAEFHFERKYNRDFSILLINNMINKVESKYSTMDAQLKATNEVFLTTKEIVQSIGLPPKVIQVCESVMERITTDVTQNKDKLSSYLTDIKTKSNLNFQFRLVELTSFIATQMIEAENAAGKDENIKKVVFASFFCDISLRDAEHLHYRDQASMKEVWPEDKKIIHEHALKSSEIVSKYKNAPEETAEIVKQHHGSPSGIGFPEAVSNDLLPMAVCLMAAQELAYQILKNPDVTSGIVVSKTKVKMANTPLSRYMDLFAAL